MVLCFRSSFTLFLTLKIRSPDTFRRMFPSLWAFQNTNFSTSTYSYLCFVVVINKERVFMVFFVFILYINIVWFSQLLVSVHFYICWNPFVPLSASTYMMILSFSASIWKSERTFFIDPPIISQKMYSLTCFFILSWNVDKYYLFVSIMRTKVAKRCILIITFLTLFS